MSKWLISYVGQSGGPKVGIPADVRQLRDELQGSVPEGIKEVNHRLEFTKVPYALCVKPKGMLGLVALPGCPDPEVVRELFALFKDGMTQENRATICEQLNAWKSRHGLTYAYLTPGVGKEWD